VGTKVLVYVPSLLEWLAETRVLLCAQLRTAIEVPALSSPLASSSYRCVRRCTVRRYVCRANVGRSDTPDVGILMMYLTSYHLVSANDQGWYLPSASIEALVAGSFKVKFAF
jgi:hypothetical protein